MIDYLLQYNINTLYDNYLDDVGNHTLRLKTQTKNLWFGAGIWEHNIIK